MELDAPVRDIADLLAPPGSPAHRRATSPWNTLATQDPAAVARVADPGDVATCLRWAAEQDLTVQIRATGHGAAGTVGSGTLLLDTSGLDHVIVDPVRAVARVGAGATWARVNAAAAVHGLIGPSGTAPDVGAAGYVFHGGIGWTTRPHGLASAALRAVEFVDGTGRVRHADPDHDIDPFWAFRGGGGIGVATEIEIALRPAAELWAGYALWPVEVADQVIPAWGEALARFNPAMSTALALLRHAPGIPDVPPGLHGTPVVHLSAASIDGAPAAVELRRMLDALPAPAVDTFGPCTAERLAGIHLDPPVPVPALGEGRWLRGVTGAEALAVLTAAGTTPDAPLDAVELRHMPTPSREAPLGALTAPPGQILLHAVGDAPDARTSASVEHGLDLVRAAAGPVDTGRSAAPFRDGRTTAPNALIDHDRRRLAAIRRDTDPGGLIVVPRPLDAEPTSPTRDRDGQP